MPTFSPSAPSAPLYPEQSSELTQFCDDLKHWIANGCPAENLRNFTRFTDLCSNWLRWSSKYRISLTKRTEVYDEMIAYFKTTENVLTPFNTDTSCFDEATNDGMYSNPARLAWIDSHSSTPASTHHDTPSN